MSIYITGDIHGEYADKRFSKLANENLTKDDTVIICGDFGVVWYGDERDNDGLDWLENYPWTTVFVEGNHDNIPAYSNFPTVEWNGGKVHQLRPSVLHLQRGEWFEIEGISFIPIGGAHSHDTFWRAEGKNWWPQEVPSADEREKILNTLRMHDNKVDIIISHEGPLKAIRNLWTYYDRGENEFQDWLQDIEDSVEYGTWFFGHHHCDYASPDEDVNTIAIYDNVVKLT